MSGMPIRSWSRSSEDTEGDATNDVFKYLVFEEEWFPSGSVWAPCIPGLDGDTRSAAYIQRAVEVLTGKAIETSTDDTWHLRGEPLRTDQHFFTQLYGRGAFQNMDTDDKGCTASGIHSRINIIQDLSDGEAAASSIRTYSSFDEDDDWMLEERLESPAVRLQRGSNPPSWSAADFEAQTGIPFPKRSIFGPQFEVIQFDNGWGIHVHDRWAMQGTVSAILATFTLISLLFGLSGQSIDLMFKVLMKLAHIFCPWVQSSLSCIWRMKFSLELWMYFSINFQACHNEYSCKIYALQIH